MSMLANLISKFKGSNKLSAGVVKWFNNQKGYGFITPFEGGPEVFVHHSVIEMEGFRSLNEGQEVEYEAVEGEKGPVAKVVKP